MEKYVSGFFQEQLAKIIIGFRKDQVNANLLNGKGEIRDVKLNCSVINQAVAELTPVVTFEEIHVSRLSFHVTSWANIRKAPIEVDIGVITAVVVEPLQYTSRSGRSGFKMVSEKELARLIEEGLFKPFRRTGSYGLVDRIVDNLAIEIKKLKISFQTWGKFKTKRIGPWTPSNLQIECKNLRSVAVDLHGHEGSPAQVWDHNRHQREAFLLCRKVELELSVHIISSNTNPQQQSFTLIKGMQMEIQLAIRQRLRDGEILAIQSDVTIPDITVDIESQHLPQIASVLAGIQYCLVKDRSFEDPLKPQSDDSKDDEAMPRTRTLSSDSVISILSNESIEEDEEIGEIDNDSTSTSSAGENDTGADTSGADDSIQSGSISQERPVLLFPKGLSIHEKLCITCSVHQLSVRGLYKDEHDGCLHFSAGGSIFEAIWPKSVNEFGFLIQTSVSYCSIQERCGEEEKILLMNGMTQDDHQSWKESSRLREEVNADESFPLFECRSIRQDPLDLRHSFPRQGFGQKITLEFLNSNVDNPKVLHEVGMDGLEIVLDVQSWMRILKFALHEPGGGYDPRLQTGDWSDVLTVDMFQDEDPVLNLDNHLQHIKDLILDENFMLSSELFNTTIRLLNTKLRIPAAIEDNIQSCDILTELKEATVVVTSDLPRTFLSGRIVDGMKQKQAIDFPNDPSDIIYSVEQGEGLATQQQDNGLSIFRQQVTICGLQVRTVPVVPLCNAPESQQLIAPTDMTLIASFEGEPSRLQGSNQTKLVIFLSIQINQLFINIDFDLLAGATSTLIDHGEALKVELNYLTKSLMTDASSSTTEASNNKVKMNLQGLYAIVQRHLSQGFSFVFCLKKGEMGISVWRQNLSLRPTSNNDTDILLCDDEHINALKLFDLQMTDFELVFEFDIDDKNVRRGIMKTCLEKFAIKVCNPTQVSRENKNEKAGTGVVLLSFGESLPGDLSASHSGKEQHFAMRCEEQMKGSRSWSFATDLTAPTVLNLYIDELKESLLLCFEALLMPMWSKREISVAEGAPFPANTVGAILHSLVAGWFTFPANWNPASSISFQYDEGSSIPFAEQVLRNLSKTFLPENLSLILFRLGQANLLVQIPLDKQRKQSLGILLNQTDVSIGFDRFPDANPSDIVDTLARTGVVWSSLIKGIRNGFYQSFFFRSSLIYITQRESETEIEMLIHPCGIKVINTDSKIDISMDETLRVSDIRLIEDILLKLNAIGEGSHRDLLRFFLTFAPTKENCSNVNVQVSNIVKAKDEESVPRGNETTPSKASIFMSKVYEELGLYEKSISRLLRDKDAEVNNLKNQVFSKEKERFGAIALLSSRVAGWIRMGGVHLAGQRVARRSTMWPFWAILRRDLLLLFDSPGATKPQDVITLVGAKIRELSGESGIKRGFAIIESSGRTCYFITSNGTDYLLWTREISSALAICNFDAEASKHEDEDELGSEENERSRVDDKSVISGPEDILANNSELESGLRQRLVPALGDRLAGAKNRFGSAIQTAKERGKEISNRARTSSAELDGGVRFESATVRQELEIPGNNTVESEGEGGETSSGIGRRFGNRFGSALQTARQRGREAAEKQASGLKNRFSGLALADTRSGQNRSSVRSGASDSGSSHNSNFVDLAWTCEACTFINNGKSHSIQQTKCNMCGMERRTGENLGSSETNDYDTVSPVAEQGVIEPESRLDNTRRKLLDIGAAVTHGVRSNINNIQQSRRDQSDESIGPSFGGGPITLKDVKASGHAPKFSTTYPLCEPLKVFLERLTAHVSIHSEDSLARKLARDQKVGGNAEFTEKSVAEEETTIPSDKEVVDQSSLSLFRIVILQRDKVGNESTSEKLFSFGSILDLHTQVSEGIERIMPQLLREKFHATDSQALQSEARQDKLDLVDKVMTLGELLGSLLDLESEISEKTISYQAEVIAFFLNSILQCPLPADTLCTIAEALGISASTKDVVTEVQEPDSDQAEPKRGIAGAAQLSTVANDKDSHREHAQKIFHLLSLCRNEMGIVRLETSKPKGVAMERKADPKVPKPQNDPTPNKRKNQKSPIAIPTKQDLHQSIHQALMKAMTERDEARARLASNNVLHTCEVEKEKRKNKLLEFELEVAKHAITVSNQGPNVGQFFGALRGGGGGDTVSNTMDAAQKQLEAKLNMLKLENNDEMIGALSQQIADELHTNAMHASEIGRLKETSKVEREKKDVELKALREELQRAKELLAKTEKDAAYWKSSYENLKRD